MLVDNYNRTITYLRLSVTDHCNLRCQYCMPPGGVRKIAREEILRYEEFLRLVQVLIPLGIKKVRLTGGEPLVRRGITEFIRSLRRIDGLRAVCLTTNGTLLGEKIDELYAAGINRINISLDTLDAQKYHVITTRPFWHKVWEAIEKALSFGDVEVKLNVVVMKGINDDEIEAFARLAYKYPLQVRFIEFMPVGCGSRWNGDVYMPGAECMERVRKVGDLLPLRHKEDAGPAVVYTFAGAAGEIGFINSISQSFCAFCNRMRITPDGQLRMCLFSDDELDVKKYLRSGMQDAELAGLILKAVKQKPLEHAGYGRLIHQCRRQMSQIGG
ncbi:MAG: GTP 3',8-cyclase MoaA [Desulfovibrionales bacterium]|nr:GTP 3',8-cyclase MoaA [Desulfovibrionales bacterium]